MDMAKQQKGSFVGMDVEQREFPNQLLSQTLCMVITFHAECMSTYNSTPLSLSKVR